MLANAASGRGRRVQGRTARSGCAGDVSRRGTDGEVELPRFDHPVVGRLVPEGEGSLVELESDRGGLAWVELDLGERLQFLVGPGTLASTSPT